MDTVAHLLVSGCPFFFPSVEPEHIGEWFAVFLGEMTVGWVEVVFVVVVILSLVGFFVVVIIWMYVVV